MTYLFTVNAGMWFTGVSEEKRMKRYSEMIILLLAISQSTVIYAASASDTHHMEEVRSLANKLAVHFDGGKPILPQVLTMRDEMHQRITKITRMSSRHSLRCKQARRQLLEVNRLIWHLRDEQTVS